MAEANLYAAWTGVLLGFATGAISGLFFYRENWLGGYASWPRRMVRLGHISFFGLAFINFAFVFTVAFLDLQSVSAVASWLFILGAATMPVVCYLSAFKQGFRHLFFIPVASLIVAAAVFIVKDLIR